MKLDDQVQDASFFAELFVLEDGAVLPNGVVALVYKIGIRFSTFGKMVTIHTTSAASDLDRFPLEQLAGLLEEHGFQYVPDDSLSEPYDGQIKDLDQAVDGQATWWYRFFDYI